MSLKFCKRVHSATRVVLPLTLTSTTIPNDHICKDLQPWITLVLRHVLLWTLLLLLLIAACCLLLLLLQIAGC